jgi:hypothetical protein
METLKTKTGIPVDITLNGKYSGKDPFFSEIRGVFTSSDGKVLSIPGFYLGNGQWTVRFSYEEEGDWTYRISGDAVSFAEEGRGKIRIEGSDSGTPRILRTQGRRFVDSAGKPVFLLGYECNFLFSLLASPGGSAKLQKFVKNIKDAGFNEVQINAYAYDYYYFNGKTRENDFGPALINLWEKTSEGRRYNPAFFDNFDALIDYLNRNGIYAQIYLRVYNKFVELPENYSEEDYAYYRLFTARYQAYPNVIWNFSKEGYFEPDREYFYHMIRQIKVWDAYHHLMTIHDDTMYCLNEKYGQTIDFLTIQQHYDWQHAHLYFLEKVNKPVVGGEVGVESPQQERCNRYPAERVAAIAWEVVMAGAYFQYYYQFSAWDVIEYDEKPKGYEYIQRLAEFFSQFDLTKFKTARHMPEWSGMALDDEESTLILYIEPAEHILGYINKEGHSYMNLSFDRETISCETFGILSGKKGSYDLKDEAHQYAFDPGKGHGGKRGKDINCFLCPPEEPTVFIIHYKKIKPRP